MSNKLENLIVQGIITATSDKQDPRFPSNNPRKSLYIAINEENTKKAKEFGLTEYVSRTDQSKFFIVKASENIDVYDINNDHINIINGIANHTANFYTEKEVQLALIKGQSANFSNTFVRLKAIKVQDPSDLLQVKTINPFEL